MKKILSILLCAALVLTLTACGGSAKNTSAMGVMREEAAAEAPAMMADNAASLKGAQPQSAALPEGRKWIITIDMTVETDDLDMLTADLDQKIKSLGGYVEDQSVHNGSNYASRRYRSANLTVRIPEEKADQFTSDISGLANVVSQNLRREDITLNYVAIESRQKALQAEETRLLALIDKAANLSELLQLEKRLTEIRSELETVTSQLKLYDNLVDYSTIQLEISEVKEYTPTEKPGFWQRIGEGFANSLRNTGKILLELLIFLVCALPYLTPPIVILGIVLLIVKLTKRKRKQPPKSEE